VPESPPKFVGAPQVQAIMQPSTIE